MKHNLPRLILIIPIFSIRLLIYFYFLLRLPLFLLSLLLIPFYHLNDLVPNKSPAIPYVIQNWKAQVLQVNSDLVSSTCDRIAF